MKRLLLLILIPITTLAQGSSTGLTSLNLPATPFVASTSQSFVADPENIQSLRINPANISSLESYNILLSHTNWIIDTKTECFIVSAPSYYGNFVFSFTNTSVNDIEIRETAGPAKGTFNFQSSVFQLSYGNEIIENIRFGASTKYLYEKNYIDEVTGYAFDFGFLFYPSKNNLVIGASVTNIGSMSKYRNEIIDLPSLVNLGATYLIHFNNFALRTASSVATALNDSEKHLNVGCELIYDKLISIRLGYGSGYEIRSFSGGVGVRYNILTLDYAFIPFTKQAGSSHTISIGFIL